MQLGRLCIENAIICNGLELGYGMEWILSFKAGHNDLILSNTFQIIFFISLLKFQ